MGDSVCFESSHTAVIHIFIHLSEEAPAAPSSIKPAFDEESPELLPGQPPAGQWQLTSAISTKWVRLLGFCKQGQHRLREQQGIVLINT